MEQHQSGASRQSSDPDEHLSGGRAGLFLKWGNPQRRDGQLAYPGGLLRRISCHATNMLAKNLDLHPR